MLNMFNTRIVDSIASPVVSGTIIAEEGMALVYEKENGATKVRPSQGVAGELFAGFSLSRNAPPTILADVGEDVASAENTVLARTPLAGQLLVKVDGTKATIVAGAPAAAGEVQLAGDTLTYHADDYDKGVSFQYMYEPTITEARSIVGDLPQGVNLASTVMSNIGMITRGLICTNYFDASVDWTDVLKVNLGAGGMLTSGGAGPELRDVVVLNAPSSENSMLIVSLSV